ncbi:Uncharacterised protein [Vibrio cholerae]|uniref:Uncharacterized protein n=1 Tax=Vibrio cholerae TaxID=666 RepID=A0A655WL81_VIBCL|nr:Uncharacterised protein [Vibrio cholerae]CSC67431.1 Uncharacterised protein [Vibrio cholerae]
MAIAALFTGTAKRNVLQDRYIIFYHGGFTNHDPRRVIEHDAATNTRCRVNIHLTRH